LQEDKPRIFDSFDTVAACLSVAAPMISQTELNHAAIKERLDRGHLDATTLMEELIRRGIPQRTAHEIVGKLVRLALDKQVRLSDLSQADFSATHPALDDSIKSVLGVENALAKFVSYGSTAPSEVAKQIKHWQELVR
jgi:argininosuccinate lyase